MHKAAINRLAGDNIQNSLFEEAGTGVDPVPGRDPLLGVSGETSQGSVFGSMPIAQPILASIPGRAHPTLARMPTPGVQRLVAKLTISFAVAAPSARSGYRRTQA